MNNIQEQETAVARHYYAIIPANVRYDKNITPTAKLLYGEITALCNEKGYCWESNKYFADLYDVSIRTVTRWVTSLSVGGYINLKYEYAKDTVGVEARYISIENNVQPPRQKCLAPPVKNVYNNNTVLNNTINNNLSTPARGNVQDNVHMKEFFKKHSHVQVDGYNGNVGEIDFKVLEEKIAESDYLKQITSFSWLCKQWQRIAGGYYKTIKVDKAKKQEPACEYDFSKYQI